MRRRLLPFTALLILGIPSGALAAAPAPEDLSAFSSSSYTYCDAKLLSSLWKQSVTDSKALIGRKVRTGSRDSVEYNLGRARTEAAKDPAKRCLFSETGFSYADADKLAKRWNMPVPQAKALIEKKVTAGNAAYLKQQLGQGQGSSASASSEDDIRAFLGSGLSYCDVKLLSQYWQKSVNDSKALAGRKVRTNNRPGVDQALNVARGNALKDPSKRCSISEAGFSYADAEKLSKIWKTSIADTKTRMETKATSGNAKYVRDLLAKP